MQVLEFTQFGEGTGQYFVMETDNDGFKINAEPHAYFNEAGEVEKGDIEWNIEGVFVFDNQDNEISIANTERAQEVLELFKDYYFEVTDVQDYAEEQPSKYEFYN